MGLRLSEIVRQVADHPADGVSAERQKILSLLNVVNFLRMLRWIPKASPKVIEIVEQY